MAAGPSAGRLVPAALIGIALIIVLITQFKVHPFLGLAIGSLVVAAIAGMPMSKAVTSFGQGFGDTAASVGTLIALGAMFGKLLADSGGADQIVDTIVGHSSRRSLPWAMAAVGALIGLPMFFEIGLVLLMPVIYLVSRRSGQSLIQVGIPALAGLSVIHGLVPPHPGPMVAVTALHANLGVTLGLGVLIALPTVVIAGPLFGKLAARWVDVPAPDLFQTPERDDDVPRPSFAVTIGSVLLPIALMLGKAIVDIAVTGSTVRGVFDFLGTPIIALLIAVVVAMFTLGGGARMNRQAVRDSLQSGLPPIAGIVLIVSAGGGFKQILIDTGIGKLVANWVTGSGISVLLLAWFVAVLIRLATGSATVATVTASGILAPLATSLGTAQTSLLVLAIGAGSLFFSHVNDAGFWLVKEYFGTTVWQNIKTWSIMETILSVGGLGFVLIAHLII
ncbi:MAG TPA: gluconate:H+ symporter [Pseudonocardiaceae bacterium]|nr:gluconate:H+ symporter [Pseudonocardiaceae bacterium]